MPLRLGTFNVWGLPRPFAVDLSARTRAIANRFSKLELDVLLIQEAWSDEVRDGLSRAATQAGFEVALASRESGGGLMVLSRLPILKNRFEKYHFRGDPEKFGQGEYIGAKGYQALVLEGEAGPLHLINTHLHARYNRSRPILNSAVRTAQLLQLVGEIHALDGAVVIGGDFNFTDEDPEYRIFKGLTGSIEVAEGRRDLSTITRSNYYKRRRSGRDKRIDFIFQRPARGTIPIAADPRLIFSASEEIHGVSRSYSDHFGISARIEWEGAKSETPFIAIPVPDPGAFELARKLLDVGRLEADRREVAHLRYAGSWIAGAVIAANIQRDPMLNRRRFLRSFVGAVGIAALAPAAGYTTLARFDSDSKRDAFNGASAVLAQLEAASKASV